MITTDRLETLPARLVVTFAADCAERVLPIFERAYPDDPRPREAIAAVRAWLEGRASKQQLERACGAAGKASAKPLGDHAVTGAPGWMTGLLANDARDAASAAAKAAAAACVAENAVDLARLASYVAGDAVMAAVRAYEGQSATDFSTANALVSPRERAWQAERLASLESDPSLNIPASRA